MAKIGDRYPEVPSTMGGASRRIIRSGRALEALILLMVSLLLSCSSSMPGDSRTAIEVPTEVYAEFRENLFAAERLAEYDKLAWEATDSIKQYLGTLAPGQVNGYVIDRYRDSIVVAFGVSMESSGFVKYCQVVFGSSSVRSVLFDSGRSGNERENKMFAAFESARRELSREEYSKGKHNFYVIPGNDTIQVYLIPGYLPGRFVFGGSFLFTYVDGGLRRKRSFHFGYQYFKDKRKVQDIDLTSDMNRVPNECDIMKFLTYREFIREMKIRTSEYIFTLIHEDDGGVGFTIAKGSSKGVADVRINPH